MTYRSSVLRGVRVEARRSLGREVAAEHDVLAGLGDRTSVRRLEDVVRRQHEQTALELGLERQRNVHGHLVTVEVGVERRADERVNTNGLSFDEHRLESLDAESVKGRRAVQQHRVIANDLFENLVHLRRFLLDDLLGALHRLGDSLLDELMNDERLEQLQRHRLGQTALVQLELGTDDDDRTAGVVDALAEQVLTEPALLALEHVGQRLERTLAATTNRLGAAAVVEQCIDCFLEHSLLVAENDFRRAVRDQLHQPVVAVDDAAIEIVQIRRRETAAVERNERTQIRRNHRYDVHDQPFGLVALLA